MTGEPTTACQTGGLRARHRPGPASRAFDGAIHTEAWPGPVATKQGAARGGLGDCRSYSWSWARPRCAGRWLTRGGAAKRGLPRATMKPPRCGSERLRAFVHNGFAIGDRPCKTVHPWNKYRNRDQGRLSFHLPTFSLFQADNAGRNMYGVLAGPVPVPEPAAWVLAVCGLIGLCAVRRFRNRAF